MSKSRVFGVLLILGASALVVYLIGGPAKTGGPSSDAGPTLAPPSWDPKPLGPVRSGRLHARFRAPSGLARTGPLPDLATARRDYPLPGPGEHVAAADLDGDGDFDLIAAVCDPGAVVIFAGLGDGTFAPASSMLSQTCARFVVVADLDSDGKQDIAATTLDAPGVTLWFGRGDLTFEAPVQLEVGTAPEALAASDLNQDGHPDLVVGTGSFALSPTERGPGDVRLFGAGLSVLLGRGDGTFAPAHRTTVPGSEHATPRDIHADPSPGAEAPRLQFGNTYLALGHLDGDARIDLVLASGSAGATLVLRGHGDGTFETLGRYDTGPFPTHAALADLDRDGTLDLVVTNGRLPDGTGDLVAILPGLGEGRFGPRRQLPAGQMADYVAVTDISGDGLLDLVVANGGNDVLGLYQGHGDGRFQAPVHVPAGHCVNALATADLDRDGRPEVIAANSEGKSLSVFRNYSGKTLSSVDTFTFENSVQILSSVQIDARPEGSPATRLYSGADGRLCRTMSGSDSAALHCQDLGLPFESMALGDIDGDGRAELAGVESGSGRAFLLDGEKHNGFARIRLAYEGSGPLSVALEDLDLDGAADLVVADGMKRQVAVATADRKGGLLQPRMHPLEFRPSSLRVRRVDRDPLPDLLLTSEGDNTAAILRFPGRASARIQPWRVREAVSADAADLNGDGTPDLAVLRRSGAFVSILLSDPEGRLRLDRELPVCDGATLIELTEATGDAAIDLLAHNPQLGLTTLYPGLPGGGFGPAIHLGRGQSYDLLIGRASPLRKPTERNPSLP